MVTRRWCRGTAAATTAAAALAGGCGAAERTDDSAPAFAEDLERIERESRGPVYWLGPSFEGLRSLVRISAPQAQARRAAAALRSIDGSTGPEEPLPPPAIDVDRALARCSLGSLDAKLDELREELRRVCPAVERRY